MTLSNTNTRMDYTGNGAVDTYSYTYKIFANSHLKVTQRDTDDVETLLVLDTDYTVIGAGDTSGGSITLTAGNLPSDYILTIRRVVPVTQETDFRNQGDFFPDIHEDQFDLTTMAEQQLGEETGRTITLPETVTGVDTELPVPAALKWFRYNAAADGFELVDAADFSTLMTTVDTSLTLSAGNLSVTSPNRIVSAGGAVDVITGTSSPAAASLTNGLAVMLEAAGANATTTPTFNLDALGAKTIVKGSGLALVAGDIPGANYRAHLVYDLSLTQWVLLNPAGLDPAKVQSGSLVYIADSGAADVYVATLVPPVLAYTDGMEVNVKIINANATTTSTLNVNALGAKTIKRDNSAALLVGDLPANHQATFRYNGTDFILQNPAGLSPSGTTWPSFSVHKGGSNQTGVVTATRTEVSFSTEEFDTNSDFASNVFTPTVAGKYLLTAGLEFTTSTDTGFVKISIDKNAAEYKTVINQSASAAADGVGIAVVVDANGSTDAFKVVAEQTSGSNSIIDGTSTKTFFTGCRIG